MAGAYYNEIDPYAAQWLRNLIAAGHIAPGDVDERDIRLVQPADLAGYTQCHFFAGVGVWSYSLRLAGWPDEKEVWSGSCPCQPFSDAGEGEAFDDERDLWPEWFQLIRERKPRVVLGEQVASRLGLAWLDALHADLEGEAYTVGAVDTCAAGFGAPHIRQRLYFVADSDEGQRRSWGHGPGAAHGTHAEPSGRGASSGVGDTGGAGPQGCVGPCDMELHGAAGPLRPASEAGVLNGFWRDAEWLRCTDGRSRPVEPGTFPLAHGAHARVGRLRAYGNAIVAPAAAEFIRAYMSQHDIVGRNS